MDPSYLPFKLRRDIEKKTGYRIYNSTKTNMQISKILPGLQTSFRADLMAIHRTFKLISTKYPNEHAHIFTDCLNFLYNLNTHIKHPTMHHNHANKTILTDMVEMLKTHTQSTTLYKIKAHMSIEGNEQADKFAKIGVRINTPLLQHYMNLHISHHFSYRTYKKTRQRSCQISLNICNQI